MYLPAKELACSLSQGTFPRPKQPLPKLGEVAECHRGRCFRVEDNVRMAQTAMERHGGIDILCCNAGIFPAAKLFAISVVEWDQVLDVNLKGTFLSVQACLPALKARGKGRIVVTSSITGPITGYPWLEPLRSQQGWAARLHPHCGH